MPATGEDAPVVFNAVTHHFKADATAGAGYQDVHWVVSPFLRLCEWHAATISLCTAPGYLLATSSRMCNSHTVV
jgi:hypothetical protein